MTLPTPKKGVTNFREALLPRRKTGENRVPTMDKTTFEARFRELLTTFQKTTGNSGCLACEGCESCVDCTFCKKCTKTTRSHYCVDCHGCTESSHCTRSRDLHGCMHCSDSERCRSSAYLVRSVDCSGCTYCYGCVGLTRKDFHILNEPYDRSTYFDMVKKLDRALGQRA
jgi:hypothetical protein